MLSQCVNVKWLQKLVKQKIFCWIWLLHTTVWGVEFLKKNHSFHIFHIFFCWKFCRRQISFAPKFLFAPLRRNFLGAIVNKFYSNLATLWWNKALRLTVPSPMPIFTEHILCFISRVHHRANVINNWQSSIAMLRWNKALRLVKNGHGTWYSQSECGNTKRPEKLKKRSDTMGSLSQPFFYLYFRTSLLCIGIVSIA